jgi:hypothetical protein
MNHCYQSGDFYKYFKENMDAIGAPVPDGLAVSLTAATGDALLIAEAL